MLTLCPPAGYSPLRPLAESSRESTWLASDATGNELVVLKRAKTSDTAQYQRVFEVLRRHRSRHLPAPHGLINDHEQGVVWLVSQWIEGDDLRMAPSCAPENLADELGELAQGLAVLHGLGVSHSDISAGNVVVRRDGSLAIVDLSAMGTVGGGTPGFLAPEVLSGVQTPASDIFSLGALAIWRIFRALPLREPDALLAWNAISLGEWLARLQERGVPRSVAELIGRMLAAQPEMRPSANEVAQSLRGRRWQQVEEQSRDFAVAPLRVAQTPSFVGPDIDLYTREWMASGQRVLLVAGPDGAGKKRTIHALVLALQSAGVAAQLADPAELASQAWSERWLLADETTVIGWQGELSTDLMSIAGLSELNFLSSGRVLVAASSAFADAVQADTHLANQIGIYRCQPWTQAELTVVMSESLGHEATTTEVSQWVDALTRVTQAWPGATIRLLRAAQDCELATPDLGRLLHLHANLQRELSQRDAILAARSWFSNGLSPSSDDRLAARTRFEVARRVLDQATLASIAQPFAAANHLSQLDIEVAQTVAFAVGDWSVVVEVGERLLRSGGLLDGQWQASLQANRGASMPDLLLAGWMEFVLRETNPQAAIDTISERAQLGPLAQAVWLRCLLRLGRAQQVANFELPETATLLSRALQLRARVECRTLDTIENTAADAGTDCPVDALAAVDWYYMQVSLCLAHVAEGDNQRAFEFSQAVCKRLISCQRRAVASARARLWQQSGNLALSCGRPDVAVENYTRADIDYRLGQEQIAAAMVRGNLAAVAFSVGNLTLSLQAGQQALRLLWLRQQMQVVLACAHNLVQSWIWVDEQELAGGLVVLLEKTSSLSEDPISRARVQALSSLLSVWRGIAPSGYEVAARALLRVGLQDESLALLGDVIRWHCQRRAQTELTAARKLLRELASEEALDRQLELHIALDDQWLAARLDSRDDSLENKWPVMLQARLAFLRLARAKSSSDTKSLAARAAAKLSSLLENTPSNYRAALAREIMADAQSPSELAQLALRELIAASDSPAMQPANQAMPAVTRQRGGLGIDRIIRAYRRVAAERVLEAVMERSVDAALELCDAERAMVRVTVGSGEIIRARELKSGADDFEVSRSVFEKAIESKESLLTVDAAHDGRFGQAVSISHLNVRSVVVVPLRCQGEILGWIYIDDRMRRGAFDEADKETLENFADLAALAVAHARDLRTIEQQRAELAQAHAQVASELNAREEEVAGLRESLRHDAPALERFAGMIGSSDKMQAVYRLIERLAPASLPVFIYGESGTGKELVARALHRASPRAEGPFVAENCGAIPETLLESVLFGHAKGAFTGADAAAPGLFEMASGGTLFLDEIGETSLAMQAKLLRVLQEGEVRRIGDSQVRPIRARIVTASNRDLEEMVRKGTFRKDLFYRVHVVKIELPPLRERIADLSALIRHFYERFSAEPPKIATQTLRRLARYGWPGNIRELENEVSRWTVLCDGEVRVEDLSPAIQGIVAEPEETSLELRSHVERLERKLIGQALERSRGNQSQAALLLGLSRFGLQKKLKRLEESGA